MPEPHSLNTPPSEWSQAPFLVFLPSVLHTLLPSQALFSRDSKSSVSLSQGPAELQDSAPVLKLLM